MRWIGLLVVLLSAGVAAAQPVSYELRGEVSLGQKPQLRLTAAQKVTEIHVELDTTDGKHIKLGYPALAKGQAVTLDIGNGAAGKLSYKGTISAQPVGEPDRWTTSVTFETLVRPLVHVGYD